MLLLLLLLSNAFEYFLPQTSYNKITVWVFETVRDYCVVMLDSIIIQYIYHTLYYKAAAPHEHENSELLLLNILFPSYKAQGPAARFDKLFTFMNYNR